MNQVFEHFKRPEFATFFAEVCVSVKLGITSQTFPLFVSFEDVHELYWLTILSQIVKYKFAVVSEEGIELVVH